MSRAFSYQKSTGEYKVRAKTNLSFTHSTICCFSRFCFIADKKDSLPSTVDLNKEKGEIYRGCSNTCKRSSQNNILSLCLFLAFNLESRGSLGSGLNMSRSCLWHPCQLRTRAQVRWHHRSSSVLSPTKIFPVSCCSWPTAPRSSLMFHCSLRAPYMQPASLEMWSWLSS